MDTNKQNDEIKRIEGYLSKFDMDKVKDFTSTMLDNTEVYDCKSYHDIAVMIHDDGIDADYLYKSHNRFAKEYGLPEMDIITSTIVDETNIGYYRPENPLYPFPEEFYDTMLFLIRNKNDLMDLLFKLTDLAVVQSTKEPIVKAINQLFIEYGIEQYIDTGELSFGLRGIEGSRTPAIRLKIKGFPKHTIYIVYHIDTKITIEVDELKN